jgi:hypothetical protein
MAEQSSTLPLHLNAIYIRSSRTEIAPTFHPTIAGQAVAGEFRTNPCESPSVVTVETAANPTVTLLSFVSSFEFRYSRITDNADTSLPLNLDDICATICVDIAVEYLLQGEMPSADRLKAWGSSTSLNHAWPYWREFCHSTMVKMQLPLSIVPLLNLQPKSPSAEAQEAPAKKPRAKKKVEGQKARLSQ